MVIKVLGKQLLRVPNVAGATLLGTGDVVIILNTVFQFGYRLMTIVGVSAFTKLPTMARATPLKS